MVKRVRFYDKKWMSQWGGTNREEAECYFAQVVGGELTPGRLAQQQMNATGRLVRSPLNGAIGSRR